MKSLGSKVLVRFIFFITILYSGRVYSEVKFRCCDDRFDIYPCERTYYRIGSLDNSFVSHLETVKRCKLFGFKGYRLSDESLHSCSDFSGSDTITNSPSTTPERNVSSDQRDTPDIRNHPISSH